MAKRRKSAGRPIPKAQRVKRSRLNRVDVTRAEYNAIVDILNERNAILNALRDAIHRLERADDVQLHRTAQIQQELDVIKRLLAKTASVA